MKFLRWTFDYFFSFSRAPLKREKQKKPRGGRIFSFLHLHTTQNWNRRNFCRNLFFCTSIFHNFQFLTMKKRKKGGKRKKVFRDRKKFSAVFSWLKWVRGATTRSQDICWGWAAYSWILWARLRKYRAKEIIETFAFAQWRVSSLDRCIVRQSLLLANAEEKCNGASFACTWRKG